MSAQLVFVGPSTAGKTSLMLGLSRADNGSGLNFEVNRTWTTRPRRPNENDEENVFVDETDFSAKHNDFLFTFSSPTKSYGYGVEQQAPLGEAEVRMRILTPVLAIKFRKLVTAPTVICAIAPFCLEPEQIFRKRDPSIATDDLSDRLGRFSQDIADSQAVADIHFQNISGLSAATDLLHTTVVEYLAATA